MTLLILAFERWSSASTIELFYRIASYTYGPLLGLFAFGLLSKRTLSDRFAPAIAVAPLLCGVLDLLSPKIFNGYKFGFEILLLNSAITMLLLLFISKKRTE